MIARYIFGCNFSPSLKVSANTRPIYQKKDAVPNFCIPTALQPPGDIKIWKPNWPHPYCTIPLDKGCQNSYPLRSKGYGILPSSVGFHGKTRDRALAVAGALDLLYQPEQQLFCTFTLPGRSARVVKAFAEYSSQICEWMLNWVRKTVDFRMQYLLKWEHHRDGVLHLHAILAFDRLADRDRVKDQLKPLWAHWLEELGQRTGLDFWERKDFRPHKGTPLEVLQVKAEVVRHSAVRYLAKYVTKEPGKAPAGSQAENQRSWFSPTRYCRYSRLIGRAAKIFTTQFAVEVGNAEIAERLQSKVEAILSKAVTYCRSYLTRFTQRRVAHYSCPDLITWQLLQIQVENAILDFCEVENARVIGYQRKKERVVAAP